MNQFLKKLAYLFVALCALNQPLSAEEKSSGFSLFTQDSPTFLAPDVAFKLALNATGNKQITAQFTIAPGHYLYKNRIKFSTTDVAILETNLPNGEMKTDATFGKQEVFHHDFTAIIKLDFHQKKTVNILASYQGCSEQGLCYAPIKKTLSVSLPENTNPSAKTENHLSLQATENTQDSSTRLLKNGNIWLIIAGFFVAGLLLSLTPCVLPMIPILSSIIVGKQTTHPSKLHSFLLSVAYVLGMALSYTLAGIAAGLSGNLLSQSLQNAWVLGATALVFVALSFSMFGFYEVKLPQWFETKMINATNQFKGGQFVGVFLMGVLSALIVSPCVAAPLAGALLYIGQTHNVFLGGLGLFALALGMGVPLLLIGASAGTILPKTGPWMNAVRNFFGVLMIAMAIWLISPLIPTSLQLTLWAFIAIICAIYLNALDALPTHHHVIDKFWKGIGIILFVYGVALFIGGLSGGKSAFQPLEHLIIKNATDQAHENLTKLNFKPIKNQTQLEAFLANTGGKSVMLDFYADWCVACKELEQFTFNEPIIQKLLDSTLLLQVDVTNNTPEDQALLKQFGLFGPPGIIFFDSKGQELTSIRTIGFQNAERFATTLNQRNQCLISTEKALNKC